MAHTQANFQYATSLSSTVRRFAKSENGREFWIRDVVARDENGDDFTLSVFAHDPKHLEFSAPDKIVSEPFVSVDLAETLAEEFINGNRETVSTALHELTPQRAATVTAHMCGFIAYKDNGKYALTMFIQWLDAISE